MPSSKLPELDCDVSAFLQDFENRLKADEERTMCNVCYEPFANVKLNCPHFLCPVCYEKLDTCPMCRKKFKTDKLVFANFDACIYRRWNEPNRYDIHVLGGEMRVAGSLLASLGIASGVRNIPFEAFILFPTIVVFGWTDLPIAIKTIREHTRLVNSVTSNPVRKKMVANGWLDKDKEPELRQFLEQHQA